MGRTATPLRIPSAGTVLEDGTIAELVYEPKEGTTAFAVGAGDSWRTERELALPGGVVLVPYSPTNNLLTHDVVALPSSPSEYGTEEQLVARVRDFIHRYVDLPEGFEELACRYVLFTWRYDDFAEVPYLRVRGDLRHRQESVSPDDRPPLLPRDLRERRLKRVVLVPHHGRVSRDARSR